MIYFITQDWYNTKGNHAGMVYLYRKIHKLSFHETKVFCIHQSSNKIRLLVEMLYITIYLVSFGKRHCHIHFSECLSMKIDQIYMAKLIKLFRHDVTISGMVHLIPSLIEVKYPAKSFVPKLNYLDYIFTLGTSLSKYLIENGCNKNKVKTLFHYVDVDYYTPTMPISLKSKDQQALKVIVMGILGRDFKSLLEIIKQVPEAHFYVCRGRKKVDDLFKDTSNVTLLGYMPEDELKFYMDNSDVSLNVMEDTVGSNVICTSMSMGLVIVVSDVGSIRDYCNDVNAIFCKNKDEYVEALKFLAKNRQELLMMKKNSYSLAQNITIEKYFDEFCSVLDLNSRKITI